MRAGTSPWQFTTVYSLQTTRLEEGHILGCLQGAIILPTPSFADSRPHELDQNVDCEGDADWMTRLLEKLNWDSLVLTKEQKHGLKELL